MIEIKEDRTIGGCVAYSFASNISHLNHFLKCAVCKRTVDTQYAFIIDSLLEAGLLPKNFKTVCCYCYRPVRICINPFCDDRVAGMALGGYCYKCRKFYSGEK